MKCFLLGLLTIFVLCLGHVSKVYAQSNGTYTTDGEFVTSAEARPPRYANQTQQKIDYLKSWIASNGSAEADFEFEDRTLEPEQVVEKPYTYEIRVGKDAVYSIDINPTADEINRTLGFEIPDALKEKILAEGGVLPEKVNSLEAYESMNATEQIRFRHVRLAILKGMARILHHAQWGIGLGIMTKDSLSYVFRKALGKQIDPKDLTLAERRRQYIQNALTSMNHRLFYQAPLVANKNEFGISGALGAIALSGSRSKGYGGILEMGISIGYNVQSKSFVFEFTISPEKFHHSIAAASVAGINYKAGFYLSSVQKGKETATLKGNSFYPPMVPGYSSDSATYASSGFSSGLGLPPPPLADFLTFSNTFEKYKILRITIPRFIISGLPSISVGDLPGLMTKTKGGVQGAYNFIVEKFKSRNTAKTCEAIFAF